LSIGVGDNSRVCVGVGKRVGVSDGSGVREDGIGDSVDGFKASVEVEEVPVKVGTTPSGTGELQPFKKLR